MKKILFFVLLLASASISVAAKQPKKPEYRPDWIYNAPRPGNSTYFYVVDQGEGSTKREALNQAIARVFQSTANRLGQFVSTDEINEALQAGTSYEVIGRNMKIPVYKVCEFAIQNQDDTWTMYILCQVAKSGNITPEFEPCEVCNTHIAFDNAMKHYNELMDYNEMEKELWNIQYKVDGWCYSLGIAGIVGGALMQIWGYDGNPGELTATNVAYAGFGMIGGGVLLTIIPSIVKSSFKVKLNKQRNNIYTQHLQLQPTQEILFSLAPIPNGLGIKCVF